jgi:hypothetical protein
MASWTFVTEAAPALRGLPGARRRASLVELFAEHGTDALLGVGLVAVLAALLAFLPGAFNVDSWLALVGGREVWQSGLPHHEVLTALALGRPWIDQQWLSQLLSYGVYLVGGLALLGLVNAVLLAGAIAGAAVGARRLGASPRSVLVALPVCAVIVIYSWEVRTQEFALPLFVATTYLLARDSRHPSARVYWCLPLLVLWANLHGTVSLGAALVVLRGLTLAWERRQSLSRSPRAWGRPAVLVVGGAASLLATPYGLAIISYYRTTLLGSTLRQSVTEWQPITTIPGLAVLFFLLAGAAVWAIGRYPGRTTLWERLALLALGAASIQVLRNSMFFGLLALLILPLALPVAQGRSAPGDPLARLRRGRLNVALAGLTLFAVVVMTVVALARSNSAIELTYQRTRVLQVVRQQTAADPALKVFADVRFADWLLWRDPALAGRVANDARFELLSAAQMTQLQNVLAATGANWKQGLRDFRLVVLDRRYDPLAVAGLLQEPGRRVLYNDGERLVILRSAKAAG